MYDSEVTLVEVGIEWSSFFLFSITITATTTTTTRTVAYALASIESSSFFKLPIVSCSKVVG